MTFKHRVAFAMLMGIVTTGIISFGLVALNLGFTPVFVRVWLRSWGLAYLIVVPLILGVAPRVQAIVSRRLGSPGARPSKREKIAFALLMGSVTTGVISFALIAVNVGFGDAFVRVWLGSWAMSYAAVIPALLVVAPRVQGLVDRSLASQHAAQRA